MISLVRDDTDGYRRRDQSGSRAPHRPAAGATARRARLVARSISGAIGDQPADALPAGTRRAESDRGDAGQAVRDLRLDALAPDGGRGDQAAEPGPSFRTGRMDRSGQWLPSSHRLAASSGTARRDGRSADAGGRDGVVRRSTGGGPRASSVDDRGHAHARRRRLALPSARGRLSPLRAHRPLPIRQSRQTRGALSRGDGASMSTMTAIQIEEWRPDPADPTTVARDLDMLAEVLRAVVYGGAGVSFFVPFSIEEARAFWSDRV